MSISDILFNLMDRVGDRCSEWLDPATKDPTIKIVEQRISRLQGFIVTRNDGIYGEINKEIRKQRFQRYRQELEDAKRQSDAERIRRNLPPRYHRYSLKEQEELLKNYPPYQKEWKPFVCRRSFNLPGVSSDVNALKREIDRKWREMKNKTY